MKMPGNGRGIILGKKPGIIYCTESNVNVYIIKNQKEQVFSEMLALLEDQVHAAKLAVRC